MRIGRTLWTPEFLLLKVSCAEPQPQSTSLHLIKLNPSLTPRTNTQEQEHIQLGLGQGASENDACFILTSRGGGTAAYYFLYITPRPKKPISSILSSSFE